MRSPSPLLRAERPRNCARAFYVVSTAFEIYADEQLQLTSWVTPHT